MSLFEDEILTEVDPNVGLRELSVRLCAEVRAIRDEAHLSDIERMLMALDQVSRCARFGWAANDAALSLHAASAILNATTMFGVFVDRRLRGLLEIYDGSSSCATEVAIVVDQNWRRRGLGWMLLNAAMNWSNERNAGPMLFIFSRHNWPMRQLTSKASAKFDLVCDEVCAEIAPQ